MYIFPRDRVHMQESLHTTCNHADYQKSLINSDHSDLHIRTETGPIGRPSPKSKVGF